MSEIHSKHPKPRKHFLFLSLLFVLSKYLWENLGIYPNDFLDPDQWLFFVFDFVGFYLAIAFMWFLMKRLAWPFKARIALAALLAIPLSLVFIIIIWAIYTAITNIALL